MEQHAIKRLAVLKAAAHAFNERGYYQTSLDDLAETLNVTKPTLYYYIKNKEEILYECKKIALETMTAAMAEAEQQGHNGLERVLAILHAYADCILDDFGMCLVLLNDSGLNPEIRVKLKELERHLNRQGCKYIEQGIADGSILARDSKMIRYFIVGAINWIPHWYRDSGKLSREQIIERFLVYARNVMVTPPLAAVVPDAKPAPPKARTRKSKSSI
ncbi:MAG: TetR/AcrR family transcriptional regulator [Proteobacteria bacterium]|nr:TetR/AcrR family transcriptional regulator [Pseudomonadota bacterium]